MQHGQDNHTHAHAHAHAHTHTHTHTHRVCKHTIEHASMRESIPEHIGSSQGHSLPVKQEKVQVQAALELQARVGTRPR